MGRTSQSASDTPADTPAAWRVAPRRPDSDSTKARSPAACSCRRRSRIPAARSLLDFQRLHDPLPVLLRQLEARLAGVLLFPDLELGLLDGYALDVERLAPGSNLGEPDENGV